MKVGPKYKICKRLGGGVFEKCQTQKYVLSEARRGKAVGARRRPRNMSDFGRQLIEKQRMRFTYGMTERQLARYVTTAHEETQPGVSLYEMLEMRLDNVVFRLGLASTRRLARQIVSHGHIRVNGKKMTVPSHIVRIGDVIEVRQGSKEKALFTTLDERLKEYTHPSWLTFDEKKLAGSVVAKPTLEGADLGFDIGAVLEFYSR